MRRATAGERGEPGDGLWTDEPGVPLLALTADCVPVALARDDRPGLAVLHVGSLTARRTRSVPILTMVPVGSQPVSAVVRAM